MAGFLRFVCNPDQAGDKTDEHEEASLSGTACSG